MRHSVSGGARCGSSRDLACLVTKEPSTDPMSHEVTAPLSATIQVTQRVARLGWLDDAKGLVIVLVVFDHALTGACSAGLIVFDGLVAQFDRAMHAIAMQVFFIVAGYVARSGLERPLTAFVRQRVTRIIWPLFLWTWMFYLVKIPVGSLANRPVDLSDFPVFPLPPRLHFWFLWVLFLVGVAAWGISRLRSKRWPERPFWTGAFAGSLVALGLAAAFVPWSPWYSELFVYLPFLLIGILLRQVEVPPAVLRPWPVHLAVFAVAAVIAGQGWAAGPFARFAIGAVGALALLLVLREFDTRRVPGLSVFAALGAASLAIYVTHTMFSASLRIALTAVDVTDPVVIVIATTSVGVALPWAAFVLARRFGVTRALGW